MPDLIDALPGVELPVGDVTERLASMWDAESGGSSSEFHALQMNLVLHFGLGISGEEVRACFDAAIRFSQRYPSRIIVLCPVEEGDDGYMASKLFSQCYIGLSHREVCCCEALILSYKSNDFGYLANQVSVWLESDLPTYHWLHRVPLERVGKYADNLLKGVRRTVYDSSVEPEAIHGFEWPEPGRVRDLAFARLLPVRQAIGQYLSGQTVEELRRGLKTVAVTHCPAMPGEGRHLLEWVRACLEDCEAKAGDCGSEVDYDLIACEEPDCKCALEMEWTYDDDRFFRWKMFKDRTIGDIEASFGKSGGNIPTRVKPLSAEQALAEALFF